MRTLIIFLFLFCNISYTFADNPIVVRQKLVWDEKPVIHDPTGNFPIEIISFEGAAYDSKTPSLPYFSKRFLLNSNGRFNYSIVNARYEPLEKKPSVDDQYLSEQLLINTAVEKDRRQYYGMLFFIPIRKVGNNRYEKLVEFEIHLDLIPQAALSQRGPRATTTSVLSNGDVYKLGIKEHGMYKLTYTFIKDALGMSDIDNIDPRQLKLFGNGAGPLPELNNAFRYDDLEENAIKIIGEEDGSFDNNDYILFYAEGPHKLVFEQDNQQLRRMTNSYTQESYYFLKVDTDNGLRVNDRASIPSSAYTSTAFNDYLHYEKESNNLLSQALGAQGSGIDWYGDIFNTTRERTYSDFRIPNIRNTDPVSVEIRMAIRSRLNSRFTATINGTQLQSSGVSGVNIENNESQYARNLTLKGNFQTSDEQISATITYPPLGDGTNAAWMDYIAFNARRDLSFVGPQMTFRDFETLNYPDASFQLGGANSNVLIWDITDPLKPQNQEVTASGNNLSFGTTTSSLRTFVAFEETNIDQLPEAVGKIDNQNIHGIENVDMVIVYHPEFEEAANRLATHREQHSNLKVVTVNLFQLYNEFSSGAQDPTAIRDFARLQFERGANFRFMILFGDASYDFRDLDQHGQHYVPTYQTPRSLHPIESFPTDDYFALLSPEEGDNLDGAIDIAIGRIPSGNITEANIVVDKIIAYDTEPNRMRDWRNRVVFVADDEDNNQHINDADGISVSLGLRHPVFNINKIYLDAYQQESTPGGARYPKVQEAINRDIFKGTLVVNYLGHGGSKGWTQERVLTNADIDSWTNAEHLPLFVTATCSFTGYDEPTITTAGEQAMLKSGGGVIGLFTTVRAVYAQSNKRLTTAVFQNIFQEIGEEPTTIGEILRISKNANRADTSGTNARKFTLIGDPSMQLAIPRWNVSTTTINGHNVADGVPDTLRALQKVTIEGLITDANGATIDDFNGRIYPTVFDKAITVTTLAQDPKSSQKDFKLQKNILFKGVATVSSGAFKFSFVVPKDIDYDFGFGKISYYAEDGEKLDARGYYDKVIIGGSRSTGFNDDQGPIVEVFMNNDDFVFGGSTNEDPTLLVKLSDDNGINVAGNSIGHDLTGVLDNNTQSTFILNDFYESALDDYTQGTVRFPLFDLEEGLHTISVKAWDIANNQADGYTEFVVASSDDMALKFVLNYPNPFTTNTNFQFEHNQSSQSMDVQIQVFTVSGHLVKTIQAQAASDNGRVSGINWDGTDDYGDRLARGVYVYKVKVNTSDGFAENRAAESEFEKLVILK